jgi:thiamine pyrophosphokinase
VRAIVVAGGEPADADLGWIDGADLVVAADAGARWLVEHRMIPDLLVGDLDSIEPALLDELEAAGVSIERHPRDKDASDAELAVERAVAAGADAVVVLGALGGSRLDHELANLLLLADSTWRHELEDLRIVRGLTTVRAGGGGDRIALEGAVGSLVTLLPVGGDAEGVRTAGLRFPLSGERLPLGRSRGLSNEVVSSPASVSLERGQLLIIETQVAGGDS